MIRWYPHERMKTRRLDRAAIGFLALSAVLVAATAGAAAPGPQVPDIDREALRARARTDFAAVAASLPAGTTLSSEVEQVYIDAYVALRTRKLEPCPSPGDATGEARPPLLLRDPLPMARAVPDTDTVLTWGKVFLDLDADSTYDAGEPGIEDVLVSRGTQAFPDDFLGPGVKFTLADGSFSFLTPLQDSRFIFVTVPSGYTATTPFFHRLTGASPDTVYFGLVATPETADPVFRWVQISDMQVDTDAYTGDELSADLAELEQLPELPDFIIITGDLVQTGSIEPQFDTFLAGIAGHTIPLHPGYGDHDSCDDTPRVTNFENYIGPTCYSFEHGGIHFILYNDIDAVDVRGEFIQFGWLFQDIVAAHSQNLPIVICKHTMPLAEEIALYNGLGGVVGAFSGHWHGSRVRLLEGIFDINTPPSRYAGIDKSSRGFRTNDMSPGAIQTTYHLYGIDDHARIAIPADGDTVIAGPVAVRINAYDSVDPFTSASFALDGPVSSGPHPLAADGSWAWEGTWDAAAAPDGDYTLTATVTPEAGSPVTEQITFTLVRASVTAADPYTDWPSYKRDATGSGHTPEDLIPPLRVAWVRHLGGRNNVESPVVAGGRVYVGTSNITTINEAALNCFDAVSGNLLWRFPARTDVKSTPCVASGRVFFTNSIGTVFALDAATGAQLWTAQLGDSTTRWEMTSPTASGNLVFVGGTPAMTALDAATGGVVWQYVGDASPVADFIPSIYSAPAVSGDTVVFTANRGIYAFDRNTGALRWSYVGGAHQHRSAAIVGDIVYTAGGGFASQRLKAYDLTTGQLLYSGTYGQTESTAGVVVTPSRVVAVHGGNSQSTPPTPAYLQGWLPTFGTNLIWNFAVGAPIASSRPYQRVTGSINSTPAVANNTAYFGADDGNLYAVDVAAGTELWRFDFGIPVRSSPAIAGNMLFVTTADGSLYAFVSTVVSTAGTGPVAAAPLRTRLLGNRPNPFNPSTTITFDVGPAGATKPVTLRVYDSAGRQVRTLCDGPLAAGRHLVAWDGRNDGAQAVASGVYFYRLEVEGEAFEDRLVLVR